MNHWQTLNRKYLMHSIQKVMQEICTHFTDRLSFSQKEFEQPVEWEPNELSEQLKKKTAIEQIVRKFRLSEFEKNILLVCAGVELNTDYSRKIATIQGNEGYVYPSFSLFLNALKAAHWDAVSPVSPLRKWKLIHLEEGKLLIDRQLRIDEQVLHFLTGFSYLNEQLQTIVTPVNEEPPTVPSQQRVASEVTEYCTTDLSGFHAIELTGTNPNDILSVAKQVSFHLNRELFQIKAQSVPQSTSEKEAFIGSWNREAILNQRILLINCFEADLSQHPQSQAVTDVALHSVVPVFIGKKNNEESLPGQAIAFEIEKPTYEEQLTLWQKNLEESESCMFSNALANQFHLSSSTISTISQEITNRKINAKAEIWATCCKYTRTHLKNLAQRIKPKTHWNDLILSADQKEILKEIVNQVRYRTEVYYDGGFASKHTRGLGISALFSGESGTGKTMAAEVIANELNLDLYRIDLSQVVDKYIGETEKNLKAIFDGAENGGAILLFDEADALFGKRSEVRDSHDRYSNMQIGYLLQRMEEFYGLSILTTNMKQAMDDAFQRRIRFHVSFERPDSESRKRIWENIFPNQSWLNGVDYDKLSDINMPGGNIKNIAMNAAFLAVAEKEKISMSHLLHATKSEYKKLDKRLSNNELKAWNEKDSGH